MTGNKMLQMVMPWQYRQGHTYPLHIPKWLKRKIQKTGSKSCKSKAFSSNGDRRVKKNGNTMLRRTLKRDMLNQLNEEND